MFKSIASAMIIASAAALPLKSSGEWLAGFLYGMTGDNHLHEIETCFKGGKTLVADAK